jgi:hypothetical protein
MSKKKLKDELITVKVTRLTHEVFHILQKRYNKKTIGEAVTAFIEDTEPNLMKIAEEALTIKERLESIYGEEVSSNTAEDET